MTKHSDIINNLVEIYNENKKTGRFNRNHGYHEMAAQCRHMNFGIEQSVESLGYDLETFKSLCKEKRKLERKHQRIKESV